MTVRRSPHAPLSVVVDPGSSPYATPWNLDIRGSLDPAALEQLLGELTPHDAARLAWRHRLLRHAPDHHTLRFSATEGAPTAFDTGRIADLLTESPVTSQTFTPAQHTVLGQGGGERYKAVLIEADAPLDASALRRALLAVVSAHPQLGSRPDIQGSRLTGAAGTGDEIVGAQDPLVEGEFVDEAAFAEALSLTGRTLDAHTGIQLRALLARDRSPADPRADRLVVLVHERAVDSASWHSLLGDLTLAIEAATGEPPVRSRHSRRGQSNGDGELRALAPDPGQGRHWRHVAEHRSQAIGLRRSAPETRPGGVPPASADVHRNGTGEIRHLGFALDEGATERIIRGLARRLALTAGQVLTGVFALALARWQGSHEVGFDVRSALQQGRQGAQRQTGRFAEPYPVRFFPDPALAAFDQLAALAPALVASAGRAVGGAGFGACREWSPDPLLRRSLRELASAQACLTLHGCGEPLPGSTRAVPGSLRDRSEHLLDVQAQVIEGRLHIRLVRSADAAAGITGASVRVLVHLLQDLLGELAATPTAQDPSVFPATPQQSELLTGEDAQPGTGGHVEQLVWAWHGSLDPARFAAAWQSVYDRETVLRTAFTDDPEPMLVVHDRVAPDIAHQICGDDYLPLLERDRLRGFDLRRPGALRFTLLETQRTAPAGGTASTRILLTYHRALLDNWSVHLLLREFYRAYLAGGTLPGGVRRPDLRDYTAWIKAQDREPAREFWGRCAPPDAVASLPGRPTGATGLTGIGRARLSLGLAETVRLRRWAALWGTDESSVLQAVWAMLIYRASGATGPAPVGFAVTVSGRGIPLDGAARMVGPLRNPLQVSLEVDPAGTVPCLLRQLRDRVMDMAAYEWVPAAWIHAWGGSAYADLATVIAFEDPPHPVEGLEDELAAHGIQADFPGTLPARSVPPIGLLAHHDGAGALTLTGVHERALLSGDAAAELLAQSALLLRELPLSAGASTTVGEALELLEGSAVPRMADTTGAGANAPLVTLRTARQDQTAVVCLIPPPGAPASCYDLLLHTYAGPQELLVLATDAEGMETALATLGTGRPLLLGGFSGAGAVACDLARRIAADGGRPPRVVLAGAVDDERERARDLARALQAAAGPAA